MVVAVVTEFVVRVLCSVFIGPLRQRLKVGSQTRVTIDQSANGLSGISNASPPSTLRIARSCGVDQPSAYGP